MPPEERSPTRPVILGRTAPRSVLHATHPARPEMGSQRIPLQAGTQTRQQNVMKKCGEDMCAGNHYAKGLCKTHYTKQWKSHNLTYCKYVGCRNKSWGSKYCDSHRRRIAQGNPDKPIRVARYSGCSAHRCDRPHYGNGYCSKHHYQFLVKDNVDHIDRNLRHKYGISREERDRMFAAQEWKCAICADDSRQLLVDHDHKHCGGPRRGCRTCVRGGLCAKCNTLLHGLESETWRGSAEEYLENPLACGF